MATRPYLPARDSTGRNVSLLNDEPARSPPQKLSYRPAPYPLARPTESSFAHLRTLSYTSDMSSPSTPDLLRTDSYDSHDSERSPVTPNSTLFEFSLPRQNSYSGSTSSAYAEAPLFERRASYTYEAKTSSNPARPSYAQRTSSSSFSHSRGPSLSSPYPPPSPYQDSAMSPDAETTPTSNRRYPCRFKDLHGCDKTFTTSGHASRHSKIHTAEKAVHCSFEGCTKKFTRADNMKQHLETHYKERVRAYKSGRAGQLVGITTRAPVSPTAGSSGLDALAAAAAYER